MSAHLEGTLVIDKQGPFVKSLELVNAGPFSPATGVKIKSMRVRMDFTVDLAGRFALREVSQKVEGRLFGIKRIDQASTVIVRPDRYVAAVTGDLDSTSDGMARVILPG